MTTSDKSTALKRKIKALQKLYGLDNEKMSVCLRMSKRSYIRRMSDVECLTVKELLRMENVLNTKFLDIEAGVLP